MNEEKKEWKCEVCGEVFETNQKWTAHIHKKHNMTSKDYYDKYLKKPGEGFCLNCGKPTRLWNCTIGYFKCCNSKCQYEYAKKKPKRGKKSKRIEHVKKYGKYKCEICGNQTNYLGGHIIQAHHITCKEYYDKYLRKPGEGICPICGKETGFLGIMKGGYLIHCSWSCAQRDVEVMKKKEKTSMKKHGVKHYRNGKQALLTRAKHLADGTIQPQKEICQSQAETDIIKFIKTFYKNKIVHGERLELEGYELDIWLPDIRVGIEYDGEYWHADPRRFKPTDIIKDKTAQEIWDKDKRKDLLCESKDIHLLRIKEYDYNHNRAEILTDLYKYIIKYDQKRG